MALKGRYVNYYFSTASSTGVYVTLLTVTGKGVLKVVTKQYDTAHLYINIDGQGDMAIPNNLYRGVESAAGSEGDFLKLRFPTAISYPAASIATYNGHVAEYYRTSTTSYYGMILNIPFSTSLVLKGYGNNADDADGVLTYYVEV